MYFACIWDYCINLGFITSSRIISGITIYDWPIIPWWSTFFARVCPYVWSPHSPSWTSLRTCFILSGEIYRSKGIKKSFIHNSFLHNIRKTFRRTCHLFIILSGKTPCSKYSLIRVIHNSLSSSAYSVWSIIIMFILRVFNTSIGTKRICYASAVLANFANKSVSPFRSHRIWKMS